MARVLNRIVALTSLLMLALLILPMLLHPTESALVHTLYKLVGVFFRVARRPMIMVMHLSAFGTGMVYLVGGREEQVFPPRALLYFARGEVKGVVLRLRVDRVTAMVD